MEWGITLREQSNDTTQPLPMYAAFICSTQHAGIASSGWNTEAIGYSGQSDKAVYGPGGDLMDPHIFKTLSRAVANALSSILR